MRIAQALAGFSLGQADVLRKAMGKKDPKVMAKQREAFMAGARAQGINEKKADQDLRPDGVLRRLRLQQVALDGLCVPGLSDRVPQGELPVALRRGAADHRVAEHRQAGDLPGRVPRARRAGAAARHQHAATGTSRWSQGRGVRFGLGAIKGLGETRRRSDRRGPDRARRPHHLAARSCARSWTCASSTSACSRRWSSRGPATRLPARRRASRCAACARAWPRRIDAACEHGNRTQRDRDLGQADLFGGGDGAAREIAASLPDVPAWSEIEQLNFEKESLGPVLERAPGGPLRRRPGGATAPGAAMTWCRSARSDPVAAPACRAERRTAGRGAAGGASRAARMRGRRHRQRPAAAEDAQGRPDVRVHAGRRARQRRGGGVPGDVQAVGPPGGERPHGGGDGQAGARRRDARASWPPRSRRSRSLTRAAGARRWRSP